MEMLVYRGVEEVIFLNKNEVTFSKYISDIFENKDTIIINTQVIILNLQIGFKGNIIFKYNVVNMESNDKDILYKQHKVKLIDIDNVIDNNKISLHKYTFKKIN